MNNMFEYLAGGQCYTCGGKVRYDEGGYTEDQQQSPIADMGQPMRQPMRQPSTLDANAKQLMKFLLEQLNKGTSERILKKTLIDSGIKSDQATQLLEVAKEEFVKLTEEGDYVNEMSQMQAMQQQQAAAMQQNQMAMSNGQSPMGMNPQQGQDTSLMAMQEGADQSQMGDQEMDAQARHGGSMRRLHRFGAGGTCPEGYEWSEMVGSCMPSVSTSNTMQQGAGAMQFGAQQAQPNAKAGIDSYNQNVIARAQAADARTQAQKNYYDDQIANFDDKRYAQQQNFQTALGGFLPQINSARDGGLIEFGPGGPTDPRLTGNPYIVETDKNKIANIDSNWVTRTLAKGNNLGNPQYAGVIGGFNPALKFLLGAGAVAGGAGLGVAKAFAGDRSRVMDDKGNVFYYNSKGDERRALKNGQQNPQNPISEGYIQPTQEQVQQYQNSQLMLPGQTPIVTSANPTDASDPAVLNAVFGSNNVGPSVNNTPAPIPTPTPQSSQTGPLQSDDPYAPNYNPNVPKTIKEDGGEWNPFVDNRRKLNISMPMYGPGGAVDNETSPYSEQEWATKTSRQFPLNNDDLNAYNAYTTNFNNPANNDNTVNTKEYTIQRGDPLGFQVASNTLQGFVNMNDAVAQINEQKSVNKFKNQQRKAGNTMAMAPLNLQGGYGTWNLNAGPGANQYVSDLGYTQDWGTQISKFGGTKSYRQGGTYEISQEELRRIIEMGGQVEFLD